MIEDRKGDGIKKVFAVVQKMFVQGHSLLFILYPFSYIRFEPATRE